MKVLKFLNKYKFIFISGLLAAVVSILIYGTRVINPRNVEWILLKGGDMGQHYLGWEFFRQSPWHFPIGLSSNISYPFLVSVIFTDSIPLWAVFFKIFSFILPNSFQYFGIYGLVCFILNGITSSIVLKKFIKNDFIVSLASLFFVINPAIIFRLYYHTSLASHFLIYSAIALVLYKDKLNFKWTCILWGILGILVSSTHLYFFGIVGFVLLGYIIYELIDTKNWKKALAALVVYVVISLLTIYILGGFSLPAKTTGIHTLDSFSFNLNGFINPTKEEYSTFLKPMPLAQMFCQDENIVYLGLGLIIGLGIALLSAIGLFIYKRIKKEPIKINKGLIIATAVVAILSLIFATAKNVYFDNTLLFEYEIPKWIEDLVGVFRSNGRFSWICYYIIIVLTIYFITKTYKIFSILIIIPMLIIQYTDFENLIQNRIEEYSEIGYLFREPEKPHKETTINPKLEQVFKEVDFKTVVMTSDFPGNLDEMYKIDVLALKYKKNVNRFNIAQDLMNNTYKEQLNIYTKNPTDDLLFIIPSSSILVYNTLPVNYYLLDNIYIASSIELPYLEKIDIDEKKANIKVSGYDIIDLDENKDYAIMVTPLENSDLNNFKVNDFGKNYDIFYADDSILIVSKHQAELSIGVHDHGSYNVYVEEID